MALLRRQAGCSSYLHKVIYLLILVSLIPSLFSGNQEAWGGTLSSVTPAGASSTVTIYITGTGFNTTASSNDVTFTHTSGISATAPATAVATLDTASGLRRLTVKVPAGMPVGTTALRVVNKVTGEAGIGKSIEVIEISMPEVSSAVPGTANLNIRITGSPNCKFVAGATRATFGTGSGITVNSTTVESATSLVANITVSATATLGARSAGVITTTQTAFRADVFTISQTVVTNSPPVLAPPGNPSLDEGASLDVTVSVTDPDGDPVTFTTSTLPGFAGFSDNGNGTGTLTLTPGYTHAGSYNVTFTAADSKGASASAGMVITVGNVNRAPSLAPIGNQDVSEGASLSFQISGSDPDGDLLTYMATGLPEGAAFDPASRTFSWTPGYNQSGTHTVMLTISDGSLTTYQSVDIAVADVNRPPSLNLIGDQTVSEGGLLQLTVSGSDPDEDPIAYSAVDLPQGASFDPVTGNFSWTPGYDQAGDHQVTFSVSDGMASAGQTIKITVGDTNRAPLITTSEIPAGRVDQAYSADIAAYDPDGDPLTYTLLQGPAGMAISPGFFRLTWRPLISDIRGHTVEVRADDGRGGSALRLLTLQVPDTIPPAVFLNVPKEAIPGATFTISTEATDNVGVASVTIDIDGEPSSVFTAPPYQREMTLRDVLPVGSAVGISVVARDSSGNTAEANSSVVIIAVPDTTPPTIVCNIPPQITRGSTVLLTGTSSDNVGVSRNAFYANGELIGAVPGTNPAITYQVPTTDVGSTVVFACEAEDFSGNSSRAEASSAVTDIPDETPPEVTLSLPQSVEDGGTVEITPQISDDTGVAHVDVYVNHILVGSYNLPPDGSLNVSLPPGLGPGMDALVEVSVTDFSGNVTTQSQYVSVTETSLPDRGVIVGEVYDDTTGLPLAGAIVNYTGGDGSNISALTDNLGKYSIIANTGNGRLAITKDGHTEVDRPGIIVEANTGREVFDARLTPLSTISSPVSAVLGGAINTPLNLITSWVWMKNYRVWEANRKVFIYPENWIEPELRNDNTSFFKDLEIELVIPSGALSSDRSLTVTQISPQGLHGLLPVGWSPLGVVEIAPGGIRFQSPVTLSVPNPLGLTPAEINPGPPQAGVILAVWDEQAHAWRSVGDAALSGDGASINGEISASGQYAFLLPDILPQPPPAPSAGDLVQGALPGAIPQDVTTAVSPQPRIIFYKPGVHSDVGLNISATSPLPSGTPVWSKITEEYNFYSGAKINTESYVQDIILYNYRLAEGPAVAGYPVTPFYTFEPLTLEKGIITVDVMAPPEGPREVALIGPAGGTITAPEGEAITVPPGAVPDFIPVEIVPLSLTGSAITLPAGFNLAGAISLSLGGNVLSLPASISVPIPSTLTGSGQFLLVKSVEILGETRLVLMGVGKVENERIVSLHTLPLDGGGMGGGGVNFEGILTGGRYLLIQTDIAIGFAGGKIYGTTGTPFPGAFVFSDTLPISTFSLPSPLEPGVYVSAVAIGTFTLTALDTQKMDTGTASNMIVTAGAFVAQDISLNADPPRVVSLELAGNTFVPPTTAEGTQNVPLTGAIRVRFSEPIDTATVTSGNVAITGTAGMVTGSIELASNNTQVTFRPANPLSANTHYTITISQGIKDMAGYSMAAPFSSNFTSLDTEPPLPPPAGNVAASIPGADGKTTITATQGTAGVHDTVWIVNTTKGTSVTVLVDPDGSFTASIVAGITDKVQIKLTDPAGNETIVPLGRFTQTNPDGSLSAAVDAEEGRIEGPGGVVVDVPEGAFPDGAVITLKPIAETDFPVQLTDEQKAIFTYSGGIQLDLGGKTPSVGKYLNLSIPAQGDETIESNPLYGYLGNEDAQWLVSQVVNVGGENHLSSIDTARVIDGRITTSSPPCPGVTGNGVYGFFRAKEVMGVTYGDGSAAVMGTAMLFSAIAVRSPLLGAVNLAIFTDEFAKLGADIAEQLTPKRYCLPVLSGRMTVVPNNVKIELYWDVLSQRSLPVLQKDIMEVIVVNKSRNNAETRFTWADREHLSVTEPDVFTVVGFGSDTYKVKLTNKVGAVRTAACFSPGTANGNLACRVTTFSSVTGIVQIKLDWLTLTNAGWPPEDIYDIDVINESHGNMVTHFRRQGQTERFSVEGGNGEDYFIKLVDNSGNVTTIACPDSGGGGTVCRTIASSFVEIPVDSAFLSGDTKKIIVKNWTKGKESSFSHNCPHQGVTCATPDRKLIVEGESSDIFTLSTVDIDSMGNTTEAQIIITSSNFFTIHHTPYPLLSNGNLMVRALPGTIDPDEAQILDHNTLHGPDHLLPLKAVVGVGLEGGTLSMPIPLNSILEGGFYYTFDGQMSNDYKIIVAYNDGTTNEIKLPKFQITVTNPQTGQTINTITGYSPPRGQPLNLGVVSSSTGGPLTLATPSSLSNVDTSADFALTFSNPVNRCSIFPADCVSIAISSGFVVQDSAGNHVQGTFRFSEGDTVVTFMPSTPLRMGDTYTISLSGVSDVFGSRLTFTTLSLDTFKPRKVASLSIGSDSRLLEPIHDISFMRKEVSGSLKTTVAAINGTINGRMGFLAIDVTDPLAPAELGGYPIVNQLRRRLTLLPSASFDLGRLLEVQEPRICRFNVYEVVDPFTIDPSTGRLKVIKDVFTGDLAVVTEYSVSGLFGLITRLSFYDITDPVPCRIGGKLLTVDPAAGLLDNWKGTFRMMGYGLGGVATLKHDNGYAAYEAVGEVGLMAVDFGKTIPGPILPKDRELPGLYPGDYRDVAIIGAPKPAPTLVSIRVTPDSTIRKPGETQQYRAIGRYSDRSELDLTAVATWGSSDTSVATVDAAGKATAAAKGQTRITAAKDGITSNGAVLRVRELMSIQITPPTASRMPGEAIQYTAEWTYSDGTTEPIPSGSLVWSSSNTDVATIDSAGLATAIAMGQTNITASMGAVTSNTAVLDVITLVSILVAPPSAMIPVGGTLLYTAVGTYSNNTTAVLTNFVIWHCTCLPVVATVDSTGLATGVAPGTEVIWAEKAGVTSNTVTLTVASLLGPWVVINEVVSEPQSDWNDSTGGDGVPFNDTPGSGTPNSEDQWIEIFNWGGFVDLTGWTIKFVDISGTTVTVTLGPTILGSWNYFIIEDPGDMAPDTTITLSDATGFVMDKVDLGAIETIVGGVTGVGDEAIARVPNGLYSNQPTDFKRRTATINGPNPAY